MRIQPEQRLHSYFDRRAARIGIVDGVADRAVPVDASTQACEPDEQLPLQSCWWRTL